MNNIKYYTDGHGNVYTGREFNKEIWNWYKWIKKNAISWLYRTLKAEYMKTYGIEEIELSKTEYKKLIDNKGISKKYMEV